MAFQDHRHARKITTTRILLIHSVRGLHLAYFRLSSCLRVIEVGNVEKLTHLNSIPQRLPPAQWKGILCGVRLRECSSRSQKMPIEQCSEYEKVG
jgi:hypothetical protein